MWDNEREFLWIHSIKQFDNYRQRLILLIVPQDFSNGTTVIVGNPSLVIHIPFSKCRLTHFERIFIIVMGFFFKVISEDLLREFR